MDELADALNAELQGDFPNARLKLSADHRPPYRRPPVPDYAAALTEWLRSALDA